MPDDYYVSEYSGEEIDALLGGAGAGTVRYDAAQSLTDVQKAQARGNIGTAPDGFGLGGNSKLLTSDDDVNTIGASGWYGWVSDNVPINAIKITYLTIMRVDAYSSGVKVQTLYGATDGSDFTVQPLVARRMIYGSKIGTWEYVNPPLNLGVEYRTTERYLGKPVYVKVVDCGNLPASGLKNIAHGIANCKPIHVYGEMSNGNTLPYAVGTNYYISADGGYIQIYVTGDLSDQTVKATIKYTKTTD